MKKLSVLWIIPFVFSFSLTAFAGGGEQSGFKSLEEQIKKLQDLVLTQNERIERLERNQRAIRLNGSDAQGFDVSDELFRERFDQNFERKLGQADHWLKGLDFKADYRLRYEGFDFTSGSPGETDPRNRFRMRLRYGFEKKFNPDMKVGFFLSSGNTTDPTSTNQTLDGNFTFKSTVIERAFAEYTPGWAEVGLVDKLTITAGKFRNPFERGSSKMIWDRDVKPEGIYEEVNLTLYDGEKVSIEGWLIAGQFILDEDSVVSGDAELFAFQGGASFVFKTPFFEKPVDLNLSTSFYSYVDYAVRGNFGTLARGNPNLNGDGELDANDFDVVTGYADLTVHTFGQPLKFFVDIAKNVSNHAPLASGHGQDFAWGVGIKIGQKKKQGDWQLGYEYRYIEPNAIVGAFSDSDFGLGFADKRGSVLLAAYKLTDDLTLQGGAYFVNNISAGTILRDEEQRRYQVDLIWKF